MMSVEASIISYAPRSILQFEVTVVPNLEHHHHARIKERRSRGSCYYD